MPRIYLDPTRAFGGVLDDSDQRLAYYRKVMADAMVASDDKYPVEFECFGAFGPRGSCR